MVFGAMTQANGFETGFSLNNVRWTGDYWISVEGYINTFDINPDGSNVFYISWLNQTQAGGAVNNICTVSLGSKYQLSSNIAMPIRIPSSNLCPAPTKFASALSFHPNGNILYYSTSTHFSNTWVNDPFIIPSFFQPSSNTIILSSGAFLFMSHAPDTNYSLASSRSIDFGDRTFLGVNRSVPIGFTTAGSSLLGNTRYNTVGGFQGILVDRKMTYIISLSGLNITSNMWLLSKFTVSKPLVGNAIGTRPKYDFVNIYPLFPANMKPTLGSGIAVDRENVQYLFINALINSKWTICKFQLRAT